MNEKLPQNNSFPVDRNDKENINLNSDLKNLEKRLQKEGFFLNYLKETIECLKPTLKDFFLHVISEKPDYIILLDKGARMFGTPFHKYISSLNLERKPKILFFNDDTYKRDFKNSGEAQEALKRDFIDSCPKEDFLNKKLFIVDETIFHGTGASLLQKFFNRNSIDGYYFALSSEGEDEKINNSLKNDKRFKIYDTEISTNDLKYIEIYAQSIADFKNPNTNIVETKSKFEYVEDIEKVEEISKQELLIKKRKLTSELQRQINDTLYKTLTEIDLSA